MKKKFLAAAIGAMLIGGSAMAVEVAHGGKGDLLIAPMVMTGGGWTSEMKVINTSTVDSAVAKVVFHSPDNSAELLDFLIFLSPGDVWVGTLSSNGTTTTMTSVDDSSLTVASNGNGCPAATGTAGLTANFSVGYTMAYANIFETRMMRNLPTVTGTTGSPVVTKASILAAYSAACVAGTAITTASTDNVLTGAVKLSNPLNGNMLILPMTTFANYDNFSYHDVGSYTGFDSNLSNTSKAALEDAFWSSDFVIPYNNAAGQFTFGTVTFPTKEAFTRSVGGSQYSPFPGAPRVGFAVRDEQENLLNVVIPGCQVSPCPINDPLVLSLPNELNVFQVATGVKTTSSASVGTEGFTKGWVNVAVSSEPSTVRSKTGNNNFGIVGLPALATYIQRNFVGNSLQGAWNYAPATFTPGNF